VASLGDGTIGPTSIITTVAGNGLLGGAGVTTNGPATSVPLALPMGVSYNSYLNVLTIADFLAHRIARVDQGQMTTWQGDLVAGAPLHYNYPTAVLDKFALIGRYASRFGFGVGSQYIADRSNNICDSRRIVVTRGLA